MLRQKMEANAPREVIENYLGLLQYYVAVYINNTLPGVPQEGHRSGRHLKTIIERLSGKDGRIRYNIQGKRTDYTARSVISADPNIRVDEFGIPREVAMTVTFPEIVTKYNKHILIKLVRNGPNKYPGAKSVKKMNYDCYGTPAPCTISLKHVDVSSVELDEGDIVHRHLQDGDVCLFNRQPSLHRMSMMGHKVRILPTLTFRMNPIDCKPYAADFDGDKHISCLQQVAAF
jgi:DNA-directed RNA polymerase beta' subunit